MESQNVAHHSRLIREVNDRVFELLNEIGSEDGEFLCECSDENCIETVQLTLREYAVLKAQEDRPLLTLPAHAEGATFGHLSGSDESSPATNGG